MQEHFFERLLFYNSQTITNLAKKGKNYDFDLPRIYSLSFLNFEPDFCGQDPDAVQHIGLANLKQRVITYPHLHFTLALIPKFNKTEKECETIQDKWLFLFSHLQELNRKPNSFREKQFDDLFELAKISNFSIEDLHKYEVGMKYEEIYNATIAYAKKEGAREYSIVTAQNKLPIRQVRQIKRLR